MAQVIKLKISKALGCFFPFAWNFLTPILLIMALTYNACFYREPLFRGASRFPLLMHFMIVGLTISLLLIVPVIGYHQVLRTPRGNFFLVNTLTFRQNSSDE